MGREHEHTWERGPGGGGGVTGAHTVERTMQHADSSRTTLLPPPPTHTHAPLPPAHPTPTLDSHCKSHTPHLR